MSIELNGQVYVITGANTGIGKVTALELAKSGAKLILACRSKVKTLPVIEEIKAHSNNPQVYFVHLDLSSLESVKRCAHHLLTHEPQIHVLINNAGVAGSRGITEQGFELAFGVNHLGHFLLTQLLLPRLKQSAPARVVTVASKAHFKAKSIDFDQLQSSTSTMAGVHEYEVSKLCNVLFTHELSRLLDGTGLTCYSLHPGVIASNIWRKVPWPIRPIIKMFMISNEEGALTTLHCASSDTVAHESGYYYDLCKRTDPSVLSTDLSLAAQLWEQSDQWVKDYY